MKDDLKKPAGLDGLGVRFNAPSKPTITVDVEKYQSFLDGTNMTDVQKEEFLQALWEIVVGFVELGFGVHPLQEVCGKDAGIATRGANGSNDALCSDKPDKDNKPNGFSP